MNPALRRQTSLQRSVKKGRPTKYTPGIAAAICGRLADGESLRSICKDADMPGQSTVYEWLQADAAFAERYARARELQADTLADQILELADECRIGEKVKELPDGRREVTTGDMVERSRLQIEARKWLAGKLRPKVYGDVKDSKDPNAGGAAELLAQLAARLPD